MQSINDEAFGRGGATPVWRLLMSNHAMGDRPGARHHIKNALDAGATLGKIVKALKRHDVRGVQACTLGVPILPEEIAAKKVPPS